MTFHRQAMRLSVCLAFMAFSAGSLYAQTGSVTGRIMDAATMRPLDGAQVSIPGTRLGSLTRGDGRFLIPGVPAGSHVLDVRFIGYKSVTRSFTLTAGQTASVDVMLESQAVALDELVVTGTGVVTERRRLGATVSSLGAQAIEAAPISNVTEALSGRVAGMMPSVSAEVGSSGNIVLRGARSITQRNTPVVYIDGIRVDNTFSKVGSTRQASSLDMLNPNDIERVEVIKGAAAATLYGTEASAGVIQIITKRGRQGPPEWTFDVSLEGTKIPTARVKESWGYDFATKKLIDGGKPALDYVGGWGPIQEYNVSVRGGTPAVQYFASGRVRDETGNMGRKYRKFQSVLDGSVRTGLTIQATDRLGLRIDVNTIRGDTHQPAGNGLSWGSGYLWGFWLATPRNPAPQFPYGGRYSVNAYQIAWPPPHGYTGPLPKDQHFLSLDLAAPVASIESRQQTQRVTVSAGATYDFGQGIKSELIVGQDKVIEEYVEHTNKGYDLGTPEGSRLIRNAERTNKSLDFKTSWQRQLGEKFNNTLVLGGQSFWQDSWIRSYGVRDFALRQLSTLDGASLVLTPHERFQEVISAGVYAQEEVALWNRLFLNAGVRVDGNSAFGDNFGFEVYPKAGASWVVSDHAFWPFQKWDQFRLRGAIGAAGLQPGAFDASQTWVPDVAVQNNSIVKPGNPGNPDLKPERTVETEVGTEMGFLQGRVGLDVVYFHSITSDALLPKPSAPSSGFTQSQVANLGEITANGMETSLNVTWIKRPKMTWSNTFQIAYNDSKITDMGGLDPFRIDIAGGNELRRYYATMAQGYPPGAWLSPVKDPKNPYSVSVPIEKLTRLSQITPNILKNAIGGDSLAFQGRSLPVWTGSVNTSLELPGNISVNALFSGGFEYQMFAEVALIQDAASRTSKRVGLMERALDDPNTTVEERRRIADDFGRRHPSSISDYLVDANFIRFADLSVNFPVPSSVVSKMKIGFRSLTMKVSASNLYLWNQCSVDICMSDPLTPYHGIPDATSQGASGAFGMNSDYGNTPSPRRFGVHLRGSF